MNACLKKIRVRCVLGALGFLMGAAVPGAAQEVRIAPRTALPSPRAEAPDTTPPPSLPGPPVRRIESAQFISTTPLGAITQVRPLSDGRVLLNDGTHRRLLMLDSTLQHVDVVLDSLAEVHNAYGTRAGTLLTYRGDSTIFIDPGTLAMLVIDDSGRITRVRAVPRAQHITAITNATFQFGVPSFDARGRFVYRIPATAAPPVVAPPRGVPYIPMPPDSAFIIAVDLDTRKADTLGAVRVARTVYSVRMEPSGGFSVNTIPNPLPLMDAWAVLADGTLAFVRGLDYRVELRASDGTITSAEKLPFPWVRMTDEEKERFTDSMRAVQIRNARTGFATQMIAWSNLLNKPYPASFVVPDSFVPPPGLPKDWILPKGVTFPPDYVPACPPGVTPPPAVAPMVMMTREAMVSGGAVSMGAAPAGAAPAGAPAGGASSTPACVQSQYEGMYGRGYTPPEPIYRAPTLVRPADLPDYKPPMSAGAARADADGNLWIRANPMEPVRGGVIYDIVDGRGVMVDRIQLPVGYQLMGFGPGKVVYLSHRDATGLHLSRVRLR